MPVLKQVGLALEDVPGVQATIAGSDLFDVLEATWNVSRERVARAPASGSLSPVATAIGIGSAEASFGIDLKGSGTAATAPRWGRAMLASGTVAIDVSTLALSVALSKVISIGDVLTDATSGATALVVKSAAIGATSVKVIVLSGTWGVSHSVTSAQKGTGVGTTHGTTVISGTVAGVAYKPVSRRETRATTSGTWTGTEPTTEVGVKLLDTGTVVGEAIFIDYDSGTDAITLEMLWGEVPDAGRVQTADGDYIDLDATADPSTSVAPTATVYLWKSGRRRYLTGCSLSWQAQADAGQPGKLTFSVQGSPVAADEAGKLTPSGFPTTTVPRFIGVDGGAQLAINGVLFPVRSVTVDGGNTISRIPDGNSSEGIKGAGINARSAKLTAVIEQTTLAAVDLEALFAAGTTVAVGWQLGTTAGNNVSFVARAAQITALSHDEDENSATHSIEFELVSPAGAGDDEFYVCHI